MKHLLVLVLTFCAMYAFADITLVEKSDDAVSVSYFSKNRIAVYDNNQVVNITDLKAEVIYGFNPENKTYFRATFKELNDIFKNSMSEMDAEDISKFKGENLPKLTVTVKKTGKGEYAGYPCDRYDVGTNELAVTSQICVSPQLRQIFLKELDAAALKKWMKLMDFESSMDPVRTKLDEISDKIGYIVYEKSMETIPGFGMQTTGESYTTFLQSVSLKPVDGSKFSVPAGYKKVSMQEALGGEE